MEEEKGHKYTKRICSKQHKCACGCGKRIHPGNLEVEHNFAKNGQICSEHYIIGHL